MTSTPGILFALDHPKFHPASATVTVAGWIAAHEPIENICVTRPDGARSDSLGVIERSDVRRLHPEYAQVIGFSGQLPARWAADGEIGIVYHTGGREHRFRRSLPHAVDMAVKSAKLRRIAPLLRPDRAGRMTEYHFDCLSGEQRVEYGLAESEGVSRNAYDEIALGLISRHAEGFVLDAGAGFRDQYHSNVVNLEIEPYPSTDVLAGGEELPFVDNAFDAVLSLSVLEHVKDPFACARELIRVLKPGGSLYASVPFLQPFHAYPHHYYNMTREGLANLFAGGLELTEQRVLDSGTPIWSLAWILRNYRAGLPEDVGARFEELKVGELMGDPQVLLGREFVRELSQTTRFELAAATVLLARKPGKTHFSGKEGRPA